MNLLIAAALLLAASHVVPSAPGIRDRLVAVLGQPCFYAGCSLLSLLALGLVIWSYRALGPTDWWYAPLDGARLLAVLGMPVPVFLLVARLTTPTKSAEPHGIYRISTVPGNLAILLWTGLHLRTWARRGRWWCSPPWRQSPRRRLSRTCVSRRAAGAEARLSHLQPC